MLAWLADSFGVERQRLNSGGGGVVGVQYVGMAGHVYGEESATIRPTGGDAIEIKARLLDGRKGCVDRLSDRVVEGHIHASNRCGLFRRSSEYSTHHTTPHHAAFPTFVRAHRCRYPTTLVRCTGILWR